MVESKFAEIPSLHATNRSRPACEPFLIRVTAAPRLH
jgi:hypothetical protein